MSSTTLPADRQLLAYARFTEELKAKLRPLITEDLIEEHRRKPLGQHSDVLMRLLNLFRRAPAYALYSRVPCREFQVIRLPVPEGSDPEPVDGTVYHDQNEALHAVFLRNLEDLMRAGDK
ncbi:MAG: hypothetical protein K2Y51_08540 [Gammaproteobacteria bacterium]|nr:hypothetical protein [Gammaproteobacteria bacterium]